MPRELRYLIFSKEETIAALFNFARQRRRPIAAGRVRRLEIAAGPSVTCTLVVRKEVIARGGPAEAPEERYVVNEVELAAALVLACIDLGIPVPATKLRKRVQVLDEHLVLVLSRGVEAGDLDNVSLTEEPRAKPPSGAVAAQATCA